ncbi:hypothetical protein MNBD_CHLOROFLEXI01-2032 [hydrothermal vent metagenome]|uniref:Uncharacterized protein n=1 Tax=hydrothermal vent metagenome TaxID=652676 RepID=A0A3B0VFQ1_9ZZZZ
MTTKTCTIKLEQFRQQLYQNFNNRLATDVTPQPRQFAHALADRGIVYQPNTIKGNIPVTIGHQYSTTVLLPEAEAGMSPSWVIPLMTCRVSTDQDKELVGSAQIDVLLKEAKLPFSKSLYVDVGRLESDAMN